MVKNDNGFVVPKGRVAEDAAGSWNKRKISAWSYHPCIGFSSSQAKSWDALNKRYMKHHPLADTRFLIPLLEHFSTGEVFCATHASDDGWDGMLLLKRAKLGVAMTFRPAQTEICPVLISSPDILRDLFIALPWSTLALQLHCQDPGYNAYPKPSSSLNYQIDHHATTVSIDLEGRFESYWEQRSIKLQKNIERGFRRIVEDGHSWRFSTVECPLAVMEAVTRYGELEVRGWKGQSGTAVHNSNAQGRLYRDVLSRFAAQGKGIVYELYLDDCLISSQLAIGNEEIVITLKTTYDENFRNFSPGRLLDYLTVQYEFGKQRFRRIEFCTNADPLLMRWGTTTRSISHITIYRNRFAWNLFRLYQGLKKLLFEGREPPPRITRNSRES